MDENDVIVKSAAARPINNGYRTGEGKVECKAQGFSFNVRGPKQLYFELLKQNALDEIRLPQDQPQSIPVFNPCKITPDPCTKQLLLHTEIKRHKLVADKRGVVHDTFQTYPYGFLRASWNKEDVQSRFNGG